MISPKEFLKQPNRFTMNTVMKRLKWASWCVCAYPFRDDSTTGKIEISRFMSCVVVVMFCVRFVIFSMITVYRGVMHMSLNPFIAIATARGIWHAGHQVLYLIGLMVHRRQLITLIHDIGAICSTMKIAEKTFQNMAKQSLAIAVIILPMQSSFCVLISINQDWIGDLVLYPLTLLLITSLMFTHVQDAYFAAMLHAVKVCINSANNSRVLLPVDKDGREYSYWNITDESIGEGIKALTTVAELRKNIREIYRIKDKVASCYRVRISSTVAMLLVDLVFFTFANMTFYHTESNESAFLIIAANGYVAINYFKLIVISHRGQQVEDAANQLRIDLNGLVTADITSSTANELLALSQELLHHAPGITIVGNKVVNDGLILAITTSTLMYTIILVQFQFKTTTNNGPDALESLMFLFGYKKGCEWTNNGTIWDCESFDP